jgi:hypothetical protein
LQYRKRKEQPDKKSRLFAGALRKTVGLSQGQCFGKVDIPSEAFTVMLKRD